jgi:hypothetical protein
MNKQVSRVLTKSVKVILCLFLLDTVFGEIQRYVFFQQKSGKFFRINYAMDKSTEDMLIYGSSHAAAHYVPEVFEKELGLSCYNAGVAGQQILFHATLQRIALERQAPKMMILDIDTYGFYPDRYHYDRLSDLHPFYSKHPAIIGRVLDLKSRLTRYALKSKLYQYNSTIVHVLRYWLSPQKDQKGYQATFVQVPRPTQTLNETGGGQQPPLRRTRPLDKNLIAALEQFIINAKGRNIPFVFIFSPNFKYDGSSADGAADRICSIANSYGIKIFNYINDPHFLGHYELFADSGHLNDPGARLFSKMVADKIRAEFPAFKLN